MGAAPALAKLQILSAPERVATALSPIRRRVLAALSEPDSATGVARRLGLPRQKVNYHLRRLERDGLVELVEERARRGCTERVMRAAAGDVLVSPTVLGALSATPTAASDRFSSAALLTGAARTFEDVARLRERAQAAGRPLATLSVETEIAFESPDAFRAFARDLARTFTRLARKYHRPETTGARAHRVVTAVHPVITKTDAQAAAEAASAPPKETP